LEAVSSATCILYLSVVDLNRRGILIEPRPRSAPCYLR
jgi:hypothetical protein